MQFLYLTAVGLAPVAPPKNFVAPTPKPLSMTRPEEQIPGLLTGGAALAVRLATGVFTLGWSPKLVKAEEIGIEKGIYGFPLGPFAFRDTSSLLADADSGFSKLCDAAGSRASLIEAARRADERRTNGGAPVV